MRFHARPTAAALLPALALLLMGMARPEPPAGVSGGAPGLGTAGSSRAAGGTAAVLTDTAPGAARTALTTGAASTAAAAPADGRAHRTIASFTSDAGVAARPPGRALDLATCLDLAGGHSPALLAALREERAARWRYYQQRALFNPTVTASTYQRQQGNLPPLGSIVISTTKITDENVALSQTLYSFGHLEAGIHTRKYQSRAARRDSQDTRAQLVFDVTKAFYDLLLAKEQVVIARETVDQVERQLRQAEQSYDSGLVARFDVVRARTQLANTRPQLIHAVQNERTSRQALYTAMGLDEDLDVDIQGAFDQRPVHTTVDGAVHVALASRPDVLALADRWKASRSALREARTLDNPVLSVGAAYDNSKGLHFPITRSIELDDYQVSLSVPIFDGGIAHTRAGEARDEAYRTHHQLQQLVQQVRLQVVQAISALDEAQAVIAASTEALREADDALSIAQEGYADGLRTNLEVLDAQLARDTARTSLATARHDYSVALARLERATGQPLASAAAPRNGSSPAR